MRGILYRLIKRILDIILSVVAIIILLPLFSSIAIAIILDSPGPIIFTQKRSGFKNIPFKIYKFRTMTIDAPKYKATSQLVNPDAYITRVGRFLRKTSLDELPQIINILKGEMSIIGPRPLILEESDILTLRTKKKVDLLYPGITGWAQINGRDAVGLIKKVEYDTYYLDNISFKLDLKIFLMTVYKVFKREGILEGHHPEEVKSQEAI